MKTFWFFAELTQAATVFISVLTLVVAIIHLVTSLDTFCSVDLLRATNETKKVVCIGPALRWNLIDFFADGNGDNGWRKLFTFEPNQFLDLWTPAIVGAISLMVHHPNSHSNPIEQSWPHYSLWYFFVALFGNFGYAGNLGIVNGFFALIVASMCLVVHFSGEKRSPDDMDIVKEWERNSLAVVRGNPVLLLSTGRLLVMIVPLLTLVCGVAHLIRTFSTWCTVDNSNPDVVPPYGCVGPWLVWGNEPSNYVQNNNVEWRGTVGAAPQVLVRNFTPIIIGCLLLHAHKVGSEFQGLLRNWFVIFFVMLGTAIFANFGYAGNFGIITGFATVCTAFVALLLHFTADPKLATFLEIQVSLESRPTTKGSTTQHTDGTPTRREFNHQGEDPSDLEEGNVHGSSNTESIMGRGDKYHEDYDSELSVEERVLQEKTRKQQRSPDFEDDADYSKYKPTPRMEQQVASNMNVKHTKPQRPDRHHHMDHDDEQIVVVPTSAGIDDSDSSDSGDYSGTSRSTSKKSKHGKEKHHGHKKHSHHHDASQKSSDQRRLDMDYI